MNVPTKKKKKRKKKKKNIKKITSLLIFTFPRAYPSSDQRPSTVGFNNDRLEQ